ncbi:transposase [Streptomyces aureoversilis]|uniref:Transposase n=1 Tax=Streptomyces aureoversilis TaxID=67277 RepID=A0ABW0A9E1_9ACTN
MTRSRSYTLEFREEAVQLALQSSKPITNVARELEVNPETLRMWPPIWARRTGLFTPPMDEHD